PATLARRPRPSVSRRSLERDHELADQVAVPGDAKLAPADALVGRPAVVGHSAAALVAHVPDLDLVVGRAQLVRRADLVTATERPHRHAFEANFGIVDEPAAESFPVAAAHGGVVGLDVLVERAHGSRSSRTNP